MTFSLSFSISVLSIVLLLSTFSQVSAHGFVSDPRTRGAYTNDKVKPDLDVKDDVKDNCAHCHNGGGKGTVVKNLGGAWRPYEPLKNQKFGAGLCGDPLGGNDHMIGGKFVNFPNVPIVRSYKPGQVVDFEVEIDTNHNGYFDFYICNLDRCGTGDIAPKCFANGSCKRLLRADNPMCDNPSPKTYFQCGPKDRNHPGRFYVPCRDGPHVGVHLVGGRRGTMKYKLPSETCKHCVIQWYWITANSCNPRGFVEYFNNYKSPFGNQCPGDAGSKGAVAKHLSPCGANNIPEEFWGCSDVSITPNGKGQTVPAKPGKGPQPTMQPQPTQTKQPQADPTDKPHSDDQTPRPMPTEQPMYTKKPMYTEKPMHTKKPHGDDHPKDLDTRKGPRKCTARHQSCMNTARCCNGHDLCLLKSRGVAQCVPIWEIRFGA